MCYIRNYDRPREVKMAEKVEFKIFTAQATKNRHDYAQTALDESICAISRQSLSKEEEADLACCKLNWAVSEG